MFSRITILIENLTYNVVRILPLFSQYWLRLPSVSSASRSDDTDFSQVSFSHHLSTPVLGVGVARLLDDLLPDGDEYDEEEEEEEMTERMERRGLVHRRSDQSEGETLGASSTGEYCVKETMRIETLEVCKTET